MRWMTIEGLRGRRGGSVGSQSSEEKKKGLSEGKADKDGRGKRMKKNPAHEENGIDEGNAELKKRQWRAKRREMDKAEVVKKTNNNWTEV